MNRSFDDAMAAFRPALPMAVAFSGGADSTALLLASAARWPGQVRAVHVHHGLQAAADGFAEHCMAVCTGLGVPLRVMRVDARHAPGASPEDAARRARYAALARYAREPEETSAEVAAGRVPGGQGIASIALAQHADDQVETLLLALSRGAGVPGLAAMPARWCADGIDYHRPLLAVPGAALRAWLAERGAQWVEDPTNTDMRYTRNRIRARLLPVLEDTFPQFRSTFARSAAHAAEAQAVLDEVAAADLQAVGLPPAIAALQGLSPGRQAQVLRRWLRTVHGTTPEAAQLAELLRQLAACTTRGHRIHLKVGAGFVRREGAALGWYNPEVLDLPAAEGLARQNGDTSPAP